VDQTRPPGPDTELIRARRAPLTATLAVERYLPARGRPTVGAWCFLDAYGPLDVDGGPGMAVGPHPHTGLQTVTWLLEGTVVHHDSLGSHQPIHPGQLNLMTAGAGIAHAELSPEHPTGRLQGVQLWVALPEASRRVPPAFEHHADLPRPTWGPVQATVLVGALDGARSGATTFSPLVGAELSVAGGDEGVVPLDPDFEHALVALDGAVALDGRPLEPGVARYLAPGRRSLRLAGGPGGRALLLGGEPFTEALVMWWNFVGGSGEEVAQARQDWEEGRFAPVPVAGVARVPAPALPPGRLLPRR